MHKVNIKLKIAKIVQLQKMYKFLEIHFIKLTKVIKELSSHIC